MLVGGDVVVVEEVKDGVVTVGVGLIVVFVEGSGIVEDLVEGAVVLCVLPTDSVVGIVVERGGGLAVVVVGDCVVGLEVGDDVVEDKHGHGQGQYSN